MTTWFSADHHFGHGNIIKFCDRPFSSVEEMDSEMIRLWNEQVDERDKVYYLGDFTLGAFQRFQWYINQLNGNFFFVPGGHDQRWLSGYKQRSELDNLADLPNVNILPPLYHLEFPRDGKHPLTITLCHYPMLSWEKSHYGNPHLHGHSHGTVGCIEGSGDTQLPPHQQKGQRMDVGVDCMGFVPISLEEVINELNLDLVI